MFKKVFSSLCAVCLSITFCPISVTAEDDPVLAYIATMKNDKFTVDAIKVGYTALDGKIPPKPDWYKYGEDTWKAHVQNSLSIAGDYEQSYGISNLNGLGIIKDGKTEIPYGCEKVTLINKNGDVTYQTALLNGNQGEWAFDGSNNTFSVSEGLGWRGDLEGAHYVDVENGYSFSYPFGTEMYNGYAAVLESLENGKTFESVDDLYTETIDDYGYVNASGDKIIKHQLSLINYKGEKVFSLSEPIQLHNAAGMNDFGFSVTGYNYWMTIGGYSEDLVWFSCDRQLGATLNDLVENTGTDKDEETSVGWGGAYASNKYKFSEHQCGYADLKGNIVISQKFDTVYPFHDGIALVGVNVEGDDPWNPVTKYGFIDKTGNYIVQPKYDYIDVYWNEETQTIKRNFGTANYSEGFAKVALKDESGALQFGYIDKTGTEVIPLQYEDAGDFSNGVAPVKKNGKWGYINTAGETVIPFEYSETYGSDGTCFVVADGANKFGAIDSDGNTILPFIFEDMSNPVNGLVYAFYNKELYSFEISKKNPNNEQTSNKFYELRYKPNSSKTILTAKFDKSNRMYDLDLLAEKWYSHVYCPELAHILSVVASGAYTKESTYEDITEYNLKQLGFTDYKPYNYYDPSDVRYERDSVAFSIAKKKLSNGDTLVLIPMRGSFGGFDTLLYEQSDWTSNFRIDQLGDEIVNYGFFAAASYVFDNLKDALGGSIPTSGVKYIITGHSRAAGVGNVLAKQMIDSGVPQANLFDYNFACPDVAMEKEAGWNPNNKYSSIFNLCVPGDLISVLPGKLGDGIFSRHQFDKADLEAENEIWRLIGLTRAEPKKWGKYGNSYWFAENWKDIPTENITSALSAHDHGNYVNVFSKKINIWDAKSYSEMKKQQWYNAFSYLAVFSESSPTRKKPSFSSIKKTSFDGESSELSSEGIMGNIDILDKNEDLIASIRNDEITFKENDDLIILLWNNEHEKCVSIYGRNDIKYRLIDGNRNGVSVNCFLSSYADNNNLTDCYAYFENVNVPENSILEMSIDSKSDQQSTVLSVLDSEYTAISTIPVTAFIPSSMYGDLTGDRDVSVDDAQLTLKAYTERIAGNDMKLTAEQIMAADVNDDGEISVDDAQNILIYYVNNTVAGKLLTWAELFKD